MGGKNWVSIKIFMTMSELPETFRYLVAIIIQQSGAQYVIDSDSDKNQYRKIVYYFVLYKHIQGHSRFIRDVTIFVSKVAPNMSSIGMVNNKILTDSF